MDTELLLLFAIASLIGGWHINEHTSLIGERNPFWTLFELLYMVIVDACIIINWIKLGFLSGILPSLVYFVTQFVVGFINGKIISPWFYFAFTPGGYLRRILSTLGSIGILICLFERVLS